MLSEVNLGDMLIAPIVVYGFAAFLIVIILRFFLLRSGILRFVWHPALFEVAVFASALSLLVLFV